MTKRALLRVLHADRVREAIAQAERQTTAEIRVSVAGLVLGSARRFAERAFVRLGLHDTQQRNGVLLLLLPWRRRVLVLGDEAAERHVEPSFWRDVAQGAAAGIAAGCVTDAVVEAVRRIGEVLSVPFPAGASVNPNELPDDIDTGEDERSS